MATTTTVERLATPLPALSAFKRNLNLARELAWTQFKLKYTGSVLGYVWSLAKPAMMFAILYVIFVIVFKQSQNEFPLQLLIAIVFFNFFTETTGAGLVAIAGNGDLIRKAFFPRPILVIASSMSAFMTFVINFMLIVAVATPLGHLHLGVRSLMVVPLIVELYALALGLALLLSSLFVFYRDLGHIWEILTQVIFYASAVVYPVTRVPVAFVHWFFVNPLAQIIEDVRHAVVITAVPWTANVVSSARTVTDPVTHATTAVPTATLGPFVLVPIGVCLAILVAGILVFRRLSPSFAEAL